MPVRVVVVRHGERIDEVDKQEWRRIRTHETIHDPPLTANGWDQAKLAGRKVADLMVRGESNVTVYSSPTARTLSTAAAILACFRGNATSVTPVYSMNCCAAAQSYGVAEAFPKVEPSSEVMRGISLACWPPLGDAARVDRLQGHGGGFVNAVKELAANHSDGDVLVLVTHREGIWQLLRHVGLQMKTGYCNISHLSYETSDQKLTAWDPSSEPLRARAARTSATRSAQPELHSNQTAGLPAAADQIAAAVGGDTLEAVLARGSGMVTIHRNGRGGGTGTKLWCTPGVRGVWAEGNAVPDGELVELLSSPVTSEGDEGDFVLVRRPTGIEGWTKVCNINLQPK